MSEDLVQSIKYGDTKSLRWRLNRSTAGLVTITVRFAKRAGQPVALEIQAEPDGVESEGVIRADFLAEHFGEGKLQVGDYWTEVHTVDVDGVVRTHPDVADRPHILLKVLATFST